MTSYRKAREHRYGWGRSPEGHQAILAIVGLTILVLFGGASRMDAFSQVIVRFGAVLLIAVCIVLKRSGPKRTLLILFAIALLATAQLVPLPAEVWANLPGHRDIAIFDAILRQGEVARPLTISTAKTVNALFALTVPLAAWAAIAHPPNLSRWRALLSLLLILATLGAILGFMQTAGSAGSNLYFYEITNRGQSVGFFANRNHHAVFLCCGIAIASYLTVTAPPEPRLSFERMLPATLGIVLTLAVIANASRAALIILLGMVLVVAIVAVGRQAAAAISTRRSHGSIPILLGLASLVVCLSMFWLLDRSPAMQRLVGQDPSSDLRASIFPILIQMASDFQPWGSGLGTFEYAYRSYELPTLFQSAYVNNAHNDWLQFVIEGGMPALAILLGSFAMIVMRLSNIVRDPSARIAEPLLGLALIGIIGAASIVSYPLRTPAFMVLGVIALALVWSTDLPRIQPSEKRR